MKITMIRSQRIRHVILHCVQQRLQIWPVGSTWLTAKACA